MIQHEAFSVEPWGLRETELNLELLTQSGSVFALGNGHLGLRANLDEGLPGGLPGTYLNGFYESHPLVYGEPGPAYPTTTQIVVNATDGTILRLVVDDEPFDVAAGELLRHERTLDFRAGVLGRAAEWRSPGGRQVRVSSTRLVSLAQRSIAAVLYEVEAVGSALRVVVHSELVANQPVPKRPSDPRTGTNVVSRLRAEQASGLGARVVLAHSTEASELHLAAAMDHVVDGPPATDIDMAHAGGDLGRVSISADLEPRRTLRILKLLSYEWSSELAVEALVEQTAAALAEARATGWAGLLASQRSYLDEVWRHADVELEGDDELQQALRFGLFHTVQAVAANERGAIAAKGLTGPGYDGHSFWDTETFVVPLLTYTAPEAARRVLQWRHATLGAARARADELGLAGAAFPWRTIAGEECSSYWPAGTAAFHVGADIAYAVERWQAAAGDDASEREFGLELLVETARLWRSLGRYDEAGQFCIDGVTGPDEYSAIADNNVYTSLMAQLNLRSAAAAAERHPVRALELGVDPDEVETWSAAADAVRIPYDEERGVHPQAQGFTDQALWDFAGTAPEQYPLLLHAPYFDLYRKQVAKQADLVLALHLRGDAFSDEEKARDFAYYEALTVRDSSLSACTQAVIAAEVGHLELAYDYFGEAALIDLGDIERNTHDGLHIASLAGAWIVAVAGFGGLRDHGGSLAFAPRLPAHLDRLRFRLRFQERRLEVEVLPASARYSLLAGAPLEIAHHREPVELQSGQTVTRAIPELSPRRPPAQPRGRAPRQRRRRPA